MKTISASDVKRRGVAAFAEALMGEPLHIIKNNRLQFVVLTEERFQSLMGRPAEGTTYESLLEAMISKPATGSRTRKEIDAALKADRES